MEVPDQPVKLPSTPMVGKLGGPQSRSALVFVARRIVPYARFVVSRNVGNNSPSDLRHELECLSLQASIKFYLHFTF